MQGVNRLHQISEVAKILKLSKNDTYDLIHHGHLKALKLGSLKVSTFELEDFMKRSAGKDFSDLENVTELEVIKHDSNKSNSDTTSSPRSI